MQIISFLSDKAFYNSWNKMPLITENVAIDKFEPIRIVLIVFSNIVAALVTTFLLLRSDRKWFKNREIIKMILKILIGSKEELNRKALGREGTMEIYRSCQVTHL